MVKHSLDEHCEAFRTTTWVKTYAIKKAFGLPAFYSFTTNKGQWSKQMAMITSNPHMYLYKATDISPYTYICLQKERQFETRNQVQLDSVSCPKGFLMYLCYSLGWAPYRNSGNIRFTGISL